MLTGPDIGRHIPEINSSIDICIEDFPRGTGIVALHHIGEFVVHVAGAARHRGWILAVIGLVIPTCGAKAGPILLLVVQIQFGQQIEAIGDGVVNAIPVNPPRAGVQPTLASANGIVIGNRKSQVYHLSAGCPGYGQVAEKNQISFTSEAEAVAAGYRKAGNCK
ncbi:hypothetical protein D9M71_584330 [compost metagenome]